ncbi:MAG: NAD(+)/NADH kinase [Vicinamibacterales bacterium]
MIESVGIVSKHGLRAAAEHLAQIAAWLDERGVVPVFDIETAAIAGLHGPSRTVARDVLPLHCDLVLVLGGDGTLIGMANRIAAAGRDVPILGVNFGSLGFLTEVTLSEMYQSLESAIAGSAPLDERLMLHTVVERSGRAAVDRTVLNDLVVTRGAQSRMISLSVSVGTQLVARFTADGLILASPTGSTAYNLSAGGPIVHPALDALVLTPIAPHTLTNRPVVLPTAQEVTVQPLERDSSTEIIASFDGQLGVRLEAGDVVRVRKAEARLRMVRAPRNYFEVLRQKLRWAER